MYGVCFTNEIHRLGLLVYAAEYVYTHTHSLLPPQLPSKFTTRFKHQTSVVSSKVLACVALRRLVACKTFHPLCSRAWEQASAGKVKPCRCCSCCWSRSHLIPLCTSQSTSFRATRHSSTPTRCVRETEWLLNLEVRLPYLSSTTQISWCGFTLQDKVITGSLKGSAMVKWQKPLPGANILEKRLCQVSFLALQWFQTTVQNHKYS